MCFSKNHKIVFLLVTGFVALVLSCGKVEKKSVETAAIDFVKEGELSIFKVKTDSLVVQLDIEIADTDYETQTGLMYRKSMEEKQGMLFVFPEEAMHSFYMKNTQIPLDLLFVDQDFKVKHIYENAEPFKENSISSTQPVQYVLEINAGLTKKWEIAIGDSLSIEKNR